MLSVLILAFGLIRGPSSANAQGLPFPNRAEMGPATLALGGASAAAAFNHEAFLTNPASLIHYSEKSSIGGFWQQLPEDHSHWSISIVDGTSAVIGGFQFDWTDLGPASRHRYNIAGAYKTPYGSLGATIQALQFSGLLTPGRGWHFTGSAGVFIPLVMDFSIGGYTKSLLDNEADTYLPPELHLGILYTYPQQLRLSFDADRRFGSNSYDWNYSFGGELLLAKYYVARGGYHMNAHSEDSFWSTGIGLLAHKIEVGAVFMRTTGNSPKNGMGADLTLKF